MMILVINGNIVVLGVASLCRMPAHVAVLVKASLETVNQEPPGQEIDREPEAA